MTIPSFSSWSKTCGALRTHWPAAIHLDLLTVMRMIISLSLVSPRQRQFVNAVDAHVVAETKLLARHREPQIGQAVEQRGVDDLQFGAGKNLPETLMNPEAERDMARGIALHVELVWIWKQFGVAVGGGYRADHAFA